MRRYLKKNILDILKTICEVHGSIKDCIAAEQYEDAQALLTDCQNTAIQIGTYIDESEGEGAPSVHFLEKYCEALYEVAVGMPEAFNGRKTKQYLDKVLASVENSIQNDIKVTLEVVFLPYKASMWDSLESIWKAADADPDCNAYVVPIPYYEHNVDQSRGDLLYEGAEYPDYVPVVRYDSYDFEKRRPDIIFIHNPYDSKNYVTSVAPQFYSERLKQYTELLVYVPYFVTGEWVPEHFCQASGVKNADRVIVQSEEIRQQYISTLLKEYGDTAANRMMLEKKILGLGSPKFDRVRNYTENDFKIPELWQEILQKPDGSRKKIVLYNTSVSTMVQNCEKWLDKVESVLQIFKENADDTACLWRPHPLTESTIKRMAPMSYRRYLSIKEKYIQERWGIFDASADVDRAIVLSDGYYGDYSSVVELYKTTGKKCMIQNVEVKGEVRLKGYKVPVSPSAFCVEGDNVWIFHSTINALIRYNMSEDKTEFMGSIDGIDAISSLVFIDMYYYDEKIILIPTWTGGIYIYKVKERIFECINLNSEQKKIMPALNNAYFSASILCDGYIYCIPYFYEYIIKMSLASFEITKIATWKEGMLGSSKSFGYINGAACVTKTEIVCVSPATNKVMVFDISSDSFDIYSVADENSEYAAVTASEGYAFLYNEKEGTLTKWWKDKEQIEVKTNLFGKGIPADLDEVRDGIIVLNTSFDNRYMIFDSELNIIKVAEELRNTPRLLMDSNFNDGRVVRGSGNLSYYFSRYSNILYRISDDEVEKIEIRLERDLMKKNISTFLAQSDSECINETEISALDIFIGCLEKSLVGDFDLAIETNIGEKIYKRMKGSI